eukprot:jgi/Psemu1/313816/fgenesh1_kg.1312_\
MYRTVQLEQDDATFSERVIDFFYPSSIQGQTNARNRANVLRVEAPIWGFHLARSTILSSGV